MKQMPFAVAGSADGLCAVASTTGRQPFPRFRRALAALVVLALCAVGARAQNSFGSEPVGSTTAAQSITVTGSAALSGSVTVSKVLVVTEGATGGTAGTLWESDFTIAGSSPTCVNAALSAGGTCTQSVTFTPSAPGLRMGAVVAEDASGNVLGTGYISGTGTGGLGVLVGGNLLPFAGTQGLYSSVDDGGAANAAELYLPAGETMDGAGNLYIADSLHNRIRMVCGAANTATISGVTCKGAGDISTIVGNGGAGYSGDGGLASSAMISQPSAVTVDGAGNLYIADTGNSVIRMVSAQTGKISTVAGIPSSSKTTTSVCAAHTDSVGDGCPATEAYLSQPGGIAVDGSGNLYIADTYDHLIREVVASTGDIETIAGDGYTTSNGDGGYSGDGGAADSAELNYPTAVAFDPAGNLYIADSHNNRIREVAAVSGAVTGASTISTFAGDGTAGYSGDGKAATAAELYLPSGLAFDPAGNLYIADTQNNAIRKVINPSASRSDAGVISTVRVSGSGEYLYNGTRATVALYGPMGLYFDPAGNLFVADYFNMVVRELQSNFVLLDFTKLSPNYTRQGSTSATISQTVENDGNDDLDLVTLTPATNAEIDSTVSNSCTAGATLPIDSTCAIGAVFAPASTPTLTVNTTETPEITATEDAQVSPSIIPATSNPLNLELWGLAEPVNGTNTAITSSPDPSGYGQSVTFTVTVTTGTGTGDLAGTVSVTDTYNGNTTTLLSPQALTLDSTGATGTATFSTSTLGVGQHTLVASYDNTNDTKHFSSTSDPYTQTVEEGTITVLKSSLNPSVVGQGVTFTATVSSSGGSVTPDGTVQFMDGADTLGAPVTVDTTTGIATYVTSTLSNGAHQITAVYSGDSTNQIEGSTSNTVTQDVQATSTLALASSANPSYYGDPVSLTAVITSSASLPASGQVIFLDNGAQIGTGTLSGNPGTATLTTSTLAVGIHPITATYAGDTYNTSSVSSSTVDQTVNQAVTVTSVGATPSPGIAGAAETINSTVTVTEGSLTPTGTVTFASGTATLGTATLNAKGTATITPKLTPGNYEIVATYGGSTDAAGSASAALPLTVSQATTATALQISTPDLVGRPITFTATVTGNGGTPTGTVNFTANGNLIGAAALNGSGVATIAIATLPLGTYSVVATYEGDTDDAGSASAAETLNVVLATTATTLNISPNPALVTATVTFTATVTGNGGTPTGTVNFVSGGTILGSATVNSSGKAVFTTASLAAGTYSVTAEYLGDSDDDTSTSAAVSETIGLIPTETNLGTSTTSGSNPEVILIATVLNGDTGPLPTGTVTFMDGSTKIGAATLGTNGVATLIPNLTAGVDYTITADYGGDADHSASTSAAVTVSGTATGFSITTSPTSITMKAGDNATIAVNLASVGDFADTITFGCGSLPIGATCVFSPSTVSLSADGTASTSLNIDTNNPLSGGNSAMNRGSGKGSAVLAGLLLPLGIVFGGIFWWLRRRSPGLASLAMFLVLAVAALFATGCNGISLGSVKPGTYTIQVVGTGTNSDVIHYQNVTLTIQ